LIFSKEQQAIGRFEVMESEETIKSLGSNPCPMPDGSAVSFEELDLTTLPGKVKIWNGDKVILPSAGADSSLLKELLASEEIEGYEEIAPEPMALSGSEVKFENAVKVSESIVQWGKIQEEGNGVEPVDPTPWKRWYPIIIMLGICGLLLFFYKAWTKRGFHFTLSDRQKNYLVIGLSLAFLLACYLIAKSISMDFLETVGYSLPLPIFTFFIALVDGFNPCNIFVLTFLLALLVSASHSRKRIYAIGLTFVIVVFLFYFIFMAAWLNIFKYIGFITPLRIALALLAIVAGLINCKELFFYRKGVTLMIQEKHKGPLVRRVEHMKDVIKRGSFPMLISSSIILAAFASLVELPCTAGFPIIYTGILSAKLLGHGLMYYLYLLLYNFIYVLPLAVIIAIFGFTFRAREISKRQMQIIKFIGGLIMLALGIILLVNPGLIGIG
ncbi:MAG: hypothetical protein ABIB71_04420, partial [Candidatus Woesearchaeota archaeon]